MDGEDDKKLWPNYETYSGPELGWQSYRLLIGRPWVRIPSGPMNKVNKEENMNREPVAQLVRASAF